MAGTSMDQAAYLVAKEKTAMNNGMGFANCFGLSGYGNLLDDTELLSNLVYG